MISCLLTHIARNPQGIAVGKESAVAGETLQIGRGAACKIHLPEHHVHLHHATLKRSEDGTIYIDCEKSVEIKVNGAMVQSASLDIGTRIEIGPYALEVLPKPQQHDIALSVELLPAHLDELQAIKDRQRNTPVTIAALGLSKRRISLMLAAAILLLFVIFPLLPGLSPALDAWQAEWPLALNEAWRPGELASGHKVLGNKCSTCHRKPFRAVGDEVCKECHRNVVGHGKPETAHGKKHCSTCHADHKEKQGLAAHDASRCAECHINLKKTKADTRLADVGDLENHPAFQLSLVGQGKAATPALLAEKNGIKFPHKVHLAETGIYSLQGDKVLDCDDCHRLEESGRRFAPIKMGRDCEKSCHELEFSEPMQGRVKHGQINEVTVRAKEFFLSRMLEGKLPKASCGQGRAESEVACAARLANEFLADSLFRPEHECGDCHEISGGKTLDSWKFAALDINRDWYPKAVFSHDKHGAARCDYCHEKSESSQSSDVSMPGIETCRECHVGAREAKHLISTRCDQCHVFHDGNKH